MDNIGGSIQFPSVKSQTLRMLEQVVSKSETDNFAKGQAIPQIDAEISQKGRFRMETI